MTRVARITAGLAVALAVGAVALAQAANGGRAGGQAGAGRGLTAGEPAPVPPQVAMLRPTAAELTQMSDELQRLISADAAPSGDLLRKYGSLLQISMPRLNTAATFTPTAQRNTARHTAFVERARQGNIDLLLHGDSITDWWVQNDAKKAVFDKYFGQYKTANFAIAGDTTQGVLWGLKNGEGQGFSPKAIMLMVGTNNMGTHTPGEIAEGIGAIVLEMRKDFPDAKILLLAIFPRGVPGDPSRERIAECNKIIQKLDDGKHVYYMDIGSKFLDDKGAFLPEAFQLDNLHPAPRGYEIWGEAVKDKIAELMK